MRLVMFDSHLQMSPAMISLVGLLDTFTNIMRTSNNTRMLL